MKFLSFTFATIQIAIANTVTTCTGNKKNIVVIVIIIMVVVTAITFAISQKWVYTVISQCHCTLNRRQKLLKIVTITLTNCYPSIT